MVSEVAAEWFQKGPQSGFRSDRRVVSEATAEWFQKRLREIPAIPEGQTKTKHPRTEKQLESSTVH